MGNCDSAARPLARRSCRLLSAFDVVSQGFANSFGNVMNSIYQLVPEDIIAAIDPIMEDIGHGLG